MHTCRVLDSELVFCLLFYGWPQFKLHPLKVKFKLSHVTTTFNFQRLLLNVVAIFCRLLQWVMIMSGEEIAVGALNFNGYVFFNFLNFFYEPILPWKLVSLLHTLKSLIEEHARLNFSDFLSTLLAYVKNEKFHPAHLLIYLVKKQVRWNFFPTLLVYSGLLFY